MGFLAVENAALALGAKFNKKTCRALVAETFVRGEKVILAKPQTYMNLSGEAVRDALNFYKLDPLKQLLVVYDDIYIDTGRVRIREKGSDGGHNGIKSIIANLGSDDFKRIRLGVGKPPQGYSMPDWVLGSL